MTSTNPFEPEARIHHQRGIDAGLAVPDHDHRQGPRAVVEIRSASTVIDPAHVQLNYDGTSLALWRDPKRTADELRYFSPSDAEALLDLYRDRRRR